MTRVLTVFLSFLSTVACFGAADTPEIDHNPEKTHAPEAEGGGIRLEVNAELHDVMTSDGVTWKWELAFLDVEVALQNVSTIPVTVPSSVYDGKPWIVDWPEGQEMERITFWIDSPKFQGKPTAYATSRFAPVVLNPGDRVLLLHNKATIQDRKRADSAKEVSVSFGVQSTFIGPKEWWRGRLKTNANIRRRIDPDKYIEQHKLAEERYKAEKEAENDSGYGRKNAARVAALIANSNRANIRGEDAKGAEGVEVRDSKWIQSVSERIASTPLPRSVHCFCEGWRTAYFDKDGQRTVSVAPIHGNQLRIYWTGGGGDYRIDPENWNAIKAAVDSPIEAEHASEPMKGVVH